MLDRHNTWNIWIKQLFNAIKRVSAKSKIGQSNHAVGVKRNEMWGIEYMGSMTKFVFEIAVGETIR